MDRSKRLRESSQNVVGLALVPKSAPGGRTLYAVPVDGGPSYWQSDDDGEHWHEVRLR